MLAFRKGWKEDEIDPEKPKLVRFLYDLNDGYQQRGLEIDF